MTTTSSKKTSTAKAPAKSAPAPAKAAVEAEVKSAATPLTEQAGREPVAKSFMITAKHDGFRRAGRAWSRAGEQVSADELTEEQIEALLAEPMLSVVVVAE